eukprot:16360215-Heterocapsa_arctica.AAC.1
MLDRPSRHRGEYNTIYSGQRGLPENPFMRDVVRQLQVSLATKTWFVGTGDSDNGETFGSLRAVMSYKKDIEQLIRYHVPRGEDWDTLKAPIYQLIKTNGHQRLQ